MSTETPPKLEDVARRAGVSTATVSRCVNTPARVREETRLRVLAAIDALGYMPHFGGQALASNRTNTIGAIIPTMENAIFARGLQAVEEALGEAGVTLLVASSGYDPEREAEQVKTLIRRGVDGLLMIGRARPEKTFKLINRHGTPLVLAWALPGNTAQTSVGFDNRGAARMLGDAVLEAGHRKIAMIAGVTAWNDRAADRLMGVRESLGSRGFDLPAEWLIEAEYTIEAAQAAFAQLMAGERPTAVICGNDVLAAGALRMASELGLRVPEDVSITGFDDIDLAELMPPGITTVHVPHRRMGRQAAATLLRLRDGETAAASTAFAASIVWRGSLAPPKR